MCALEILNHSVLVLVSPLLQVKWTTLGPGGGEGEFLFCTVLIAGCWNSNLIRGMTHLLQVMIRNCVQHSHTKSNKM